MVVLVGALAVGAPAACDDDEQDAVVGSGTIVSDERDVSGFREIHLEGSGRVTVDQGADESLTIETDGNLLPLITTDVTGARLVIRHEEPISPSQDILYRIEATELDGVSIAGSADLVAPDLACDTFTASVAGAGSFDVGGACDRLDVQIAGSGDVDGEDLAVARADVTIAGSGDVIVDARDELHVSITGSGDVVYVGDPATDIDIQGSGNVRRAP
jgi:hypothetical protein